VLLTVRMDENRVDDVSYQEDGSATDEVAQLQDQYTRLLNTTRHWESTSAFSDYGARIGDLPSSPARSREQEVSSVVKIPHKIEFEIESSPSKIASRKYLPTNEKNARLQKGQEFSANVPKGELTARATKEDKNDTEISSPKNTKN
jgi:hypothetical protein